MQHEFERQGLGYVLRIPEIATEIAVGRLVQRAGDMHGEVTVTSGLPGTRSADGYLHSARMNLASMTARLGLSKALTVRANAPEVDWTDLLETFCRRVLAAERAGEPIELAGTRPQRITPPWRVDPILAMDKPTILYGEGGVGKSTLSTAIAVSVETGVTIIPGWIPRRANVLYLDWEATVDDLDERVKAIASGANIPHPVSIRYRRCYRPLSDQVEDLAEIIAEQSIGLIVVDSIALAAGSHDGAEASEAAIRLFGAFRMLSTTILALAHVSKADQSEPGRAARPYGSVFYTNLARATFELRRAPSAGEVARIGVYNTKSNVRRPLLPVGLQVTQDDVIAYSRFEVTDDVDLSRPLTVWERARAALLDGPMDDADLVDMVGSKEDVIRATLARKRKEGKVDRDPNTRKWHLIGRAG